MAFAIEDVPGLLFMPDLLTEKEETTIIAESKANPGHPVLQIHPAHEFGWSFARGGAVNRRLKASDRLGPMPDVLTGLWLICQERALLPAPMSSVAVPDHALINVYPPGDGCVAHTDDLKFWQDWVVGVSLGSSATLVMQPPMMDAARDPVSLWLPPRSIYVLTGDARYRWTHMITAAKKDRVDGVDIARDTRTSITFRTISPSMLPARSVMPKKRKRTESHKAVCKKQKI